MNISLLFNILCAALAANGLPSNRIYGGHAAEDGAYPYQISLQIGGRHDCGGAILNERYIVTAAHCVRGLSPSSLEIVVGTNFWSKPGAKYGVEKIIAHDYNSSPGANDIALLRTTEGIEFNEKVQPIELPREDIRDHGHPVNMTGWGEMEEAGPPTADQLQEIKLQIYDQEKCKDSWSLIHVGVTEEHICTFTRRGEGTCKHDSGSPLAADGVLLGLGCFVRWPCATGYPDVYTRVYHFVEWIQKNMI